MTPRCILIVEDEHALGTAMDFAVRRTGHLPTLVATGTAALDSARKNAPEAAIIDIGLPDMSGLEVIKGLRALNPTLPVLVITAHGTLEHAIAARKNGATDYLVKPLELKQLEATVHALLAGTNPVPSAGKAKVRQEVATGVLVGSALSLREVFEGISRACVAEGPVLITGPSGSGKSLTAQVIHENSKSRAEPFIYLDCAAIKALPTAPGTVVLEEITHLAPALQKELSTRLSMDGTQRWIITTSHLPADAMRTGGLRPEVYYALSALHLELPPLSERSTDISALAAHFLPQVEVSAQAMDLLQAYDWPGNLRELQHVLVMASDFAAGAKILPTHLPHHLIDSAGRKTGPVMPAEVQAMLGRWMDARLEATPEAERSYDHLMDQLETLALQHLLSRYEGKPTYMATALRMNRTTLRQKLRRLGLNEVE